MHAFETVGKLRERCQKNKRGGITQKKYSLRKFKPSDITGIVQLFNIVFKSNNPRTEEWWTWKYQKNPVGCWDNDGAIWIAEDDGKIVGHYAVIPYKIKIANELIIAGQSVDTAVHPEYRKMGIFSALAKKVYADVKDRCSLLFCFPSEMAYAGLLGLGWKEYPVTEFAKFVNYDRVLSTLLSSNRYTWAAKAVLKTWTTVKQSSSISNLYHKAEGDDVVLQKNDSFGDKYNDFWKTMREDSPVIIERTASYLNWRFSNHFGPYQVWVGNSAKDGRMLGFCVFRKTQIHNVKNVLDILDLFSLPKEDKFILVALELVQNEKDVNLIRVSMPNWHRYAGIISKKGFIETGSIVRRFGKRFGMYGPKFLVYDFEGRNQAPKINDWFYSLADIDST